MFSLKFFFLFIGTLRPFWCLIARSFSQIKEDLWHLFVFGACGIINARENLATGSTAILGGGVEAGFLSKGKYPEDK